MAKNESNRSADTENVPGPSVDWSKVANSDKIKVDHEIEENETWGSSVEEKVRSFG